MASELVTLFMCGDVMLGRGVDQILMHPGDPVLQERWARDARLYVELARNANGPIPVPVGDAWPWGEALAVLDEARPHARIINLETAITRDGQFAPAKRIHYRMNPANLGCLAVARPDVGVLANNHVLDFGPKGLTDTIDVLTKAGIATAGAGRDRTDAWRPVVTPIEGGRRVLVIALATGSSGVPSSWAATADRSGVAYVPHLNSTAVADIVDALQTVRQVGDLSIVSIHWGSNWGYPVSTDQIAFAHQLIDSGVDVVHGHSSHHPRPIEVYHDKLILYGCGDLINDYEGIGGQTFYRPDLRLLYLVTIDASTGEFTGARLAPMRARQMRLQIAPVADGHWLQARLGPISVGCQIRTEPDGTLIVEA